MAAPTPRIARRRPMSLSRRRLFQRFGSAPVHGEWIAARGREAAVAEGSLEYPQQARAAGASSNVIRIASNENPLGPGQHVVDVIVGKFPEAGRYPFNAKEQEPVLDQGARHQVWRHQRSDRPRPRIRRNPDQRRPRVHVSEQAAGAGLADVREPAGHGEEDRHRSARGRSRQESPHRRGQAGGRLQGRRARVLLQPE